MHPLQRALTTAFRAAPARKPDPHRRAREWAKPVAAEYGIEIEKLEGGWNVWPPKSLTSRPDWVDAYEGDHYAQDWAEIRSMVAQYAHDCGQR